MVLNITYVMPIVSLRFYFAYYDLTAGNTDHYKAVVKGFSWNELCDFS